MKALSKSEVYRELLEIHSKHNEDISTFIESMSDSESIPYEVLVFINRYNPLPQLEVYNRIYGKKRNNPLYKNLVNENASIEDRVIALSSLMTQSLIRLKELPEENRQEHSKIMHLSTIAEAICDYSVYGNTKRLNETFMMVRDVCKNLFG